MQPIRVQTGAGLAGTAIMHVAETDASIEDLRVTAMHLRSPIHTLMFNGSGTLLGANTSAMEACHIHTPGEFSGCIMHSACICHMRRQ